MDAGMTFCCPRKKLEHAKNRAKHIRHRCRAMRCAPEMPRCNSTFKSSTATNAAKDAAIQYGVGGMSSSSPVGLLDAMMPQTIRTAAAANANTRSDFESAGSPFSSLHGHPGSGHKVERKEADLRGRSLRNEHRQIRAHHRHRQDRQEKYSPKHTVQSSAFTNRQSGSTVQYCEASRADVNNQRGSHRVSESQQRHLGNPDCSRLVD
jgi:hypothetical protein